MSSNEQKENGSKQDALWTIKRNASLGDKWEYVGGVVVVVVVEVFI